MDPKWTVFAETRQTSLVWVHEGHVMCRWTHLDASYISSTPKSAPATKSGCLIGRQLLESMYGGAQVRRMPPVTGKFALGMSFEFIVI